MHFEYKGHLHIHTNCSDGVKPHAEIAQDAIAAGLDFIMVTDHNVRVDGVEGYYGDEKAGRLLMLVGEEVHDEQRHPQASHCLIFGAETGLAEHSANPQRLIDAANQAGGFCYLAHPFEVGSPLLNGDELASLSWEDWDVTGYLGLEIWNYMSEFKSFLTSKLNALLAAYYPDRFITGPFKDALAKWDELLSAGQQVACVGGGDVHGGTYRLGPFVRVVFPYQFVFRQLNTHVLTSQPLVGDWEKDKQLVLSALRRGNAWVGYDGAADTSGFRFSAQALKQQAIMGDELRLTKGSATFQVAVPAPAHIRLLCNGQVVAETARRPHLIHQTDIPGAYRVEAYRRHAGRKRGWVFSNPIYLHVEESHDSLSARL